MGAYKHSFKILLSVWCVMLLVRCGKNTDEACEILNNKGVADLNMLTGTWEFQNFDKIGGFWTKKEQPPTNKMTLVFRADSSFKGQGPCNSIAGIYHTQGENALLATDTGTTTNPCSGDLATWESRYFKAIRNMQCYTIEDGKKLEVYFEDGDKNLMRFTKR